ncbi:MAG: winged helix-turn-helix domain-containing protein [Candidatus Omnitrophica bacterium]|nr:winged helix-turn-helix domain-containing protein [Candidatus Omnitrophota bacterium]
MKEFMHIAKALADENRVRTLMFLRNGELCVCQIIEMLQLAPSTVSKHLAILRQAGLIDSRKDGRWIYYRLPESDGSKEATTAIEWIKNTLAFDKRILADDQRLVRVRAMCIEELCNHYGTGQRGNGTNGMESGEVLDQAALTV